jgi:predicted Zn-dependent protease
VAEFSNPQLPDGINNSDEHPLRSFLALAGALLVIALLLAGAIAFFGGAVARQLPYRIEAELIAPYAERSPAKPGVVDDYLQRLADRMAEGLALPEGMRIRAHYVDEPVANAFATLGGNIVIYRGLLERLPDENALAMVVAHEIGHAQHRHPIASLGRGVALAAAVGIFSSAAGSGAIESALGTSGMLTALTFSRAQEEEADDVALARLVGAYGHAGGAVDTFRALREAAGEKARAEPPKFLSTHPLTDQRIARLEAMIATSGWAADGRRVAIPQAVRAALKTPGLEEAAHDANVRQKQPGEPDSRTKRGEP